MLNVKRAALAGAAVCVVAVAGCTSSSGPAPASTIPSSKPSPSVEATSQPASAVPSPGTSTWQWREHQVVAAIPVGWTSESSGIHVNPDKDGEIGIGLTGPVTRVYSDACRSENKLDPVGPTALELVAALDAQVSTDATITSPTLNGRSWTRVDLAEAPGVDRAACRYGAEGPLQIWADPEETDYYAYAPGTTGSVLVTEINGDLVVVTTAIDDKASATQRAELESIIASMRLDPA